MVFLFLINIILRITGSHRDNLYGNPWLASLGHLKLSNLCDIYGNFDI